MFEVLVIGKGLMGSAAARYLRETAVTVTRHSNHLTIQTQEGNQSYAHDGQQYCHQ